MPALRLRVIIILVTILQLTVSPAMSQPKCDFLKIAKEFIVREFPFIDFADRNSVISEADDVLEVRYDLPHDSLGFVPVISIDKRTCAVVDADIEQ
jgi:hypothetical protein